MKARNAVLLAALAAMLTLGPAVWAQDKDPVSVFTFVPQVAVGYEGPVGSSPYWTAEVNHIIVSPGGGSVMVYIRNGIGKPLACSQLWSDGQRYFGANYGFGGSALGSGTVMLSIETAVVSGYLIVVSKGDVVTTVTYHRRDPSGKILAEVGVSPILPGALFYAQAISTTQEETGLALLNQNTASLKILVELFSVYYRRQEEPLASVVLDLPRGEKLTKFLFELFPNLPPNDGGGQRITDGYVRVSTVPNGAPLGFSAQTLRCAFGQNGDFLVSGTVATYR